MIFISLRQIKALEIPLPKGKEKKEIYLLQNLASIKRIYSVHKDPNTTIKATIHAPGTCSAFKTLNFSVTLEEDGILFPIFTDEKTEA